MKTETLQKVMKAINSYNSGELGPEQAFAMLLLPVMVEAAAEDKPAQPLELSEETIDTIYQRRAEGNISELQVLALILLDQLQAKHNELNFEPVIS